MKNKKRAVLQFPRRCRRVRRPRSTSTGEPLAFALAKPVRVEISHRNLLRSICAGYLRRRGLPDGRPSGSRKMGSPNSSNLRKLINSKLRNGIATSIVSLPELRIVSCTMASTLMTTCVSLFLRSQCGYRSKTRFPLISKVTMTGIRVRGQGSGRQTTRLKALQGWRRSLPWQEARGVEELCVLC
jgi:hypothetical protein